MIILNYWFIEKYAFIYLIVCYKMYLCISFLIIKQFSKYGCIIIKEIMI